MFENLYNSLSEFAKKVETGLALGVMDLDLGIEEKVKPNIIPVGYDLKKNNYEIKSAKRGRK